jgi:uncharacterized protein (DUF1330 family)
MRIETVNALINALNSVSKDATRFNIQNVLIEQTKKENVISITATNGHFLTQVFLEDDLYGHLPEKGIMILDTEIKKLKALKIKRIDSFKIDGAKWIINGLTIETTQGQYPNYRQIIPEYKDDETMSVSFNAEYLERMLQAMRSSKNKTNVILKIPTVESKSQKAILVTVSGEKECSGVLMQCRF